MSSKTVIAKYSISGETFEIFVDSEMAYEYITGKRPDPMSTLQVEEVFTDANKGERASAEKVKKAFGTNELPKIVEKILKNGNVPITTEQRNKLLADKRKQIVTIIARNAIDPRTNAPHPAQRIENAMEQSKVSIDAFKSANEQVDAVIKKINMLLPIKFATAKMEVTIPADSANRCYGVLKQYGLKEEKWQDNGSLNAVVEFPAGLQAEFTDKINSLTHGSAMIKMLGV
ncbi:MAG: ribosome assembly factor SBDS [Candidatus Micrarchaeota archaeon]|nr:ribosome assembly factor SBDS [Candidatus Micrarchaeota archaeon]MDE1846806.1 ribosome assembly factor SBDS [Candidatus Micrarchaeota archaeon]